VNRETEACPQIDIVFLLKNLQIRRGKDENAWIEKDLVKKYYGSREV